MRKSVGTILMAILGSMLSAFAQIQNQNMLPNDGFLSCHAGDDFPARGWGFQYNNEVSGHFIQDAAFSGEGPVLKVVNPAGDEGITVRGQHGSYFDITEPGKYRASVWVKADSDAKPITDPQVKKMDVKLFVLRDDWKGFSHRKTASTVQQDWVEHEYEFIVPEDMLSIPSGQKYYFRIDISGTGTFYIADPVLEKIDEADYVQKKEVPLRETARFSFDKGLKSKRGISPANASEASLAPGFNGKSVTVEDGGALSYPIADLIKGSSGSIALWIRKAEDPRPRFAPADPICFSISGMNESGKAADELFAGAIYPTFTFTSKGEQGSASVRYVVSRKQYYGKEWRHYAFTWDKRTGLKVYVDGRLFSTPESLGNMKYLSKIKPERLHLFPGNGNLADDRAFFDEIRLFNRALNDQEAMELYESYIPAYPVLLDYATIAGSKNPYRVRMVHNEGSATVDIHVIAEDVAGNKLFEETLTIDETADLELGFFPKTEGDYRLRFTHGGRTFRTYEITAIPDRSITESLPESVSGNPAARLIEEIDCVKEYPASRYVDDGKVEVVDSPIGKYRTSTLTTFNFQKPNGFVYNFKVKNPGNPHWLEIEYPNDKPRVFYVVAEQKLDNYVAEGSTYSFHYSLDTIGVSSGVNNPVSGAFSKKRLLFWPDAEDILIGCFGYKTYSGCYGPAMKSIRLYECSDPLPRLKVNPPEDLPNRSIGNWQEDPFMPNGCWFSKLRPNVGKSFSFWEEKLRRRIEYTRFMGQNQTVFQVFDYYGDNTGAQGVFPMAAAKNVMPGWCSLAATMFEREEIPFYIQFNDRGAGLHQMIGLDRISKDSAEASAKGLDALELMTADGTFVKLIGNHGVLNFLRPDVRETHLKRLRFYRDQFGAYDTFRGLSYWYSLPVTFRDEKTGYGDYTISLFEKETGIRVPVEDKGMGRFGKRYRWLKASDAWEPWMDWRCRKLEDFLLALTGELNAGTRKDLKMILPLHTETKIPFVLENILDYPERIDLVDGFRTKGIDLAALGCEPSLIIQPGSVPNYGAKYKKGREKNLDALWYSDDFAALLESTEFPAMLLNRHANFEIYGSRSSAIKEFWWPLGYWGNNGGFHCFSSAMPDNAYLPQTLAWSLAQSDLWHVDHGWWGNPENGAHEEYQKFYQAYRAIPAVHFEKVSGVNDPVMVRQYNNPEGASGWFYLVNMQHYKTGVKITFESEVELTNAVLKGPEKVAGSLLEQELEPYQVCCFRSVKPIHITGVEQVVPESIVTELARIVADLKSSAIMASSAQAELMAAAAEKMLKEKRYTALYYLTKSYSAKQLLKDAGKPVVLNDIRLDADRHTLNIDVMNRMTTPASVTLILKTMSESLDCPEKVQTFSMEAEDHTVRTFALAGLDLNHLTGRDELAFEFETRINGGDAQNWKHVVRPVVTVPAAGIRIDGDLSDWNPAYWNRLGTCAKSVSIGAGKPGPFKSEFATKWSPKGFYLAIRVEENDLIPAPAGRPGWKYDYWEIMFDQKNNTPVGITEMDQDDCGFSVSNLENKSLALRLNPEAMGQAKDSAARCRVEMQRTGSETAYEMFIPSSVLSQASFRPGANIGFALKLHNREHRRDSPGDLWDYAVSTPGYPCNNPDVWNDLLLSEET